MIQILMDFYLRNYWFKWKMMVQIRDFTSLKFPWRKILTWPMDLSTTIQFAMLKETNSFKSNLLTSQLMKLLSKFLLKIKKIKKIRRIYIQVSQETSVRCCHGHIHREIQVQLWNLTLQYIYCNTFTGKEIYHGKDCLPLPT